MLKEINVDTQPKNLVSIYVNVLILNFFLNILNFRKINSIYTNIVFFQISTTFYMQIFFECLVF